MDDDIRCESYQPRFIDDCVSLFISVFNSPPWNDRWTEERARCWLARLSSEPVFRGFCGFEGERLIAACLGRLEMWWRGEEYHVVRLSLPPLRSFALTLEASLRETCIRYFFIIILHHLHHCFLSPSVDNGGHSWLYFIRTLKGRKESPAGMKS
jgi:hypothetical protein